MMSNKYQQQSLLVSLRIFCHIKISLWHSFCPRDGFPSKLSIHFLHYAQNWYVSIALNRKLPVYFQIRKQATTPKFRCVGSNFLMSWHTAFRTRKTSWSTPRHNFFIASCTIHICISRCIIYIWSCPTRGFGSAWKVVEYRMRLNSSWICNKNLFTLFVDMLACNIERKLL